MSEQIKNQFESQVSDITNIKELELLRVKYLGKNGFITNQMKSIPDIQPDMRKAYGEEINNLKKFIVDTIEEKKLILEEADLNQKLLNDVIDISLPSRRSNIGSIHPITHTIKEIKSIFHSFGFNFVEGPEIEDDWHNFTALNINENHPARQMHDTFYIKNASNILLRTQTSNVQIRSMSGSEPPFRNFTIGKTFRSDSDATHSPMFHQLEVICVDKDINLGHMKYCIEQFLQKFFEIESAPIRLRTSYFPFTEPSVEVDVLCDRSNKDQLIIGKGNDWLEILGCGMIHDNVFKNCNIDASEYQGFAIGMGIERLAMLKYNISDLRKFYDGDVRWLNHYGF